MHALAGTGFSPYLNPAKFVWPLRQWEESSTVTTALPFVIPSAPRISYYAAPEMATCAAFIEESRMKFADPTKLDRKSGEAEGSAVHLIPS